jgi:hypothetical protein
MVSGCFNSIEEIAERLFEPEDDFIKALHGIALEMAGNPTKEEWKAMMKKKMGIVEPEDKILINPVYGDYLSIK